MQNRRSLFWLLFLGGAAVLAVLPEFFDPPADEVVQVVEQRGALAELRSAPSAPPPAPAVTATAVTAGGGAEAASQPPATQPAATPLDPRAATPTVDLFAAHSWHVAPPAPPPSAAAVAASPPPPPPPSAPPMPFQFLGKLDDSEKLRIFLVRGERIYTVSAGDVIDGTYRVERISATQMTLIYLPLNTAQTLSVGSNL